jgi:NAD(P)-dependent dehydrogenase (short-subunit alcohol dehydrogenase family)
VGDAPDGSGGPDLTGKVVVVTGASRGIGKGVVAGLARLGASVVCAARSEVALRQVAGDIDATGGTALAVRCDIGDGADIEHLVAATVERFGGVDALINNAMTPTRVPFARSDVAQWDESMRVNVRSLYLFARAVVPLMAARGGGSIVNVSSHAADHSTSPFMPEGYLIYCVAKAALERFSSALAPEVRAQGVAVNALRPGAVRTEGTEEEFGADFDWKGWQTPADLVAPIATLAASKASDLTGRVLDVAGFGTTWPEPPAI